MLEGVTIKINGAVAGAVKGAVHAAVSGAIIAGIAEGAPKDVVEARLAVCKACDKLKDGRCEGCGCFVASKAALLSQVCPLGKW